MSTGVTLEPAHPRALPAPALRWRLTRGHVAGLAALGILAVVPVPFGNFGYFVAQYALVYAMIGLSVVVATGYAGLLSLMPYTFAGIGVMAAGVSQASWGWPFWLAVPLGAAATIPVALVVGVASVRLKGLYLAIATLTLANALGETFFQSETVTGVGGWTVTRPRVGPIDFAGDLPFYLLCLGSVLLLVWMVEGLRTSRVGRAMLAVRDNELEAQALGINVYRTKIVALLISAMLAGVGGAFLADLQITVTPHAFRSPIAEVTSFLLVTTVAIGGIDRALGAFVGAIALVVQQQVFAGAEFFYPFFGIYTALVLILLLKFRPGGLIQIGKLQLELIRRRPVFGTAIATGILSVNLGLAWLFVRLS